MQMFGAGMRRGAMLVVVLVCALTGVAQARLTWSAPVFLNDGQQAPLNAVACPALSQCTAVDFRGMEVTFDPATPQRWSAYAIDGNQPVNAIACASTTRCTAVDGRGNEVTFNPASTTGGTAFAIDPGHSLYGIACPAASQCTAVDRLGQEVTFDPTPPSGMVAVQIGTTAQVGNGVLWDVACPSSTQCTAIDSGSTFSGRQAGPRQLVTFDPTSPGEETTIPVSTLDNKISCPSLTECVATASQPCSNNCAQGATVTFDPTSSAIPAVVTRSHVYYGSLDCPTASQCTAMDLSGQEVSFDPNRPSTTTEAPTDTPGDWPKGENLAQIACPSTTVCALVATTYGSAEVTIDPLSPHSSQAVSIDDGASNNAVVCPTHKECVALAWVQGLYIPPDGEAVSATFDPRSLAAPAGQPSAGGAPGGISCPTSTRCTLVTRRPSPCHPCDRRSIGLEVTYNPRHPGLRSGYPGGPAIDNTSLAGVSCPATTRCTAIDIRGRELTFNPRRPGRRVLRRIDRSALAAVDCPAATECIAVDRRGSEVTFDPRITGAAVRTKIDDRRALTSISCPATNRCTAVDDHGFEITFDPIATRRLTRQRIDVGALNGVSCPSRTFCVAVDGAGRVLAGDPHARARWAEVSLPGAGAVLSVACSSPRQCVAVDADGHAYTGRA